MDIKIKYDEKEKVRLEKMWKYEYSCYEKGYIRVAGIDEAGRGPLAGPVVAAAVILDINNVIPGINDSKKLSEKKREYLHQQIMAKAVAVGIGIVDELVIDTINIRNATHLAMKRAIENLSLKPDFLLIDAETLYDIDIDQMSIIKGDSLSISIAAASIIAKVERDRIVKSYEDIYPGYGFAKHKGYGTKQHIDSIKKFGLLPVHRKTFTKNF